MSGEHRCRPRVGVVFDVDGTLFDSEPFGHRIAFNRAFAELGIDVQWDLDCYAQLLSITGGRRRIERYLLDSGWAPQPAARAAVRVHRRKTELIVELALSGRIPPRSGITRLLPRLVEAGAELHVATTGSAVWVRPLLAATFGNETFAVVITGDDVLELEPAPEVYQQVMAGADLDAGHLVAVEDSWNGFTAAREAGLTCMVVTDPYVGGGPFAGAGGVRTDFEDLDPEDILELTPCQNWRAGVISEPR